jgi:hypothetical protein
MYTKDAPPGGGASIGKFIGKTIRSAKVLWERGLERFSGYRILGGFPFYAFFYDSRLPRWVVTMQGWRRTLRMHFCELP